MKKFTSVLLLLAVCCAVIIFGFILKAYWPQKEPINKFQEDFNYDYEADNEWAYDKGFSEGYEIGRDEALFEALKEIRSHLEYELWDLELDVSEESGIHPEEALVIIEDYLDGEPISESELNKALDALSQYYYGVIRLPDDIDQNWLE